MTPRTRKHINVVDESSHDPFDDTLHFEESEGSWMWWRETASGAPGSARGGFKTKALAQKDSDESNLDLAQGRPTAEDVLSS